jgi:hypothetical protein
MVVISPNADPGPPLSVDNASLAGPQTPVTAPTGAVTRQLTFGRWVDSGPRWFQGKIISADDYSCIAGTTKVTIFREAKKPVKVGTTTTTSLPPGSASFWLKLKKNVKGSYYASVTRSESPLDGNICKAARSKGVKVR